ncbi:MAG: DUF421 domain-containing protein [Alphaproteobacteria bacterium]
MEWIGALIGEGEDLLWWQMSIRAVLILVFGLVLIRLFGRRAFGKQNPLDIVVAIVVGSNLSRALTGNAPFLPTLIATAVLLGVFCLLEEIAARWHLLSRLLKGQPVALMRDRTIDRRAMKRWGVTDGDIEEAARQSGKPGLDAIDDALLERSGKISTISRG